MRGLQEQVPLTNVTSTMPETLTCPHCQNSISTTKTAELSPQTRINCKHCGKPYSISEGRATSPTPVFDPVEDDEEEYRPYRKRFDFRFCSWFLTSLAAVLLVFSPIAVIMQWMTGEATAGPWLTMIGGLILGTLAIVLDILSDIEENTRRH